MGEPGLEEPEIRVQIPESEFGNTNLKTKELSMLTVIILSIIGGSLVLALHYGGEWIIRWEVKRKSGRR